MVESGKVTETDIPADLVDEVAQAREELIEAVAVADDELMMKYLEGEELSNKEIETALSLGTKSKEVIPILCGSATANIGVDGLLDYLVFCMPSAKDVSVKVKNQKTDEEVEINSDNQNLVALVYKTMADPYVGKLTLFRVYSGTLKSDSVVFNSSTGKEERVGQLFVTKGKEQIAVSEIGPGDLGAVAKLKVPLQMIHFHRKLSQLLFQESNFQSQ